jgi:phage gp36-like protein
LWLYSKPILAEPPTQVTNPQENDDPVARIYNMPLRNWQYVRKNHCQKIAKTRMKLRRVPARAGTTYNATVLTNRPFA